MTKQKEPQTAQEYMPSAEEVQAELAKVQSMDDFFGKDGVLPNSLPRRWNRCWKEN